MNMRFTEPVIQDMGGYDQQYGKGEQLELVMMPDLFGQEEADSGAKEQPGAEPVMVSGVSMPERPAADQEGQTDHSILKTGIFYDIDAQDGQAGYHQGQDGAVNSA